MKDQDGDKPTKYNNQKDPTLFHYDEIEGRWVFDLSSAKASPQTDFILTAKVKDQYGNEGTSTELLFTIVDEVIASEIELVTNTAYDGVSNITKKNKPFFKLKNIDPNATEVRIKITGGGVNYEMMIHDKSRIKLQDLLQDLNSSFDLDQP